MSAEKIRQLDEKREDTIRILFSDEKMFDLDGIYNSQYDRIWAVNREEANWRSEKKTATKVSTKIGGMVRGRCAQGGKSRSWSPEDPHKTKISFDFVKKLG